MQVCLVSSISFYQELVVIKNQLLEAGVAASIPPLAEKMEREGNYDLAAHRDYYGGEMTWEKKGQVMKENFDRLLTCDQVVVINLKKNGQAGYIGGNVLMEMALAFQANLPLYLWLPANPDSTFYDEIMGMQPVVLNENIEQLLAALS